MNLSLNIEVDLSGNQSFEGEVHLSVTVEKATRDYPGSFEYEITDVDGIVWLDIGFDEMRTADIGDIEHIDFTDQASDAAGDLDFHGGNFGNCDEAYDSMKDGF